VSTIKILFLIIIPFILFPQIAPAQQNQIKVATDSWPPFRIHDEKGSRGIDFYLWQEIAKELNLDIKYTKYPWARIIHNLKSGEVDAMSGLAKRASREVFMYYTSPSYYKCSTVFYVKKGNKNLIRKYEDLYYYSIAYVNGSAYFKQFDEDSKIDKYPVASEIQLIKMLAKDRVDVIIGTDCQADYEIKKLGFTNKFDKTEFKPKNNVDLYITISKKSPFAKELKRVNEVIKQIVDEGKIKEYSKKYFE